MTTQKTSSAASSQAAPKPHSSSLIGLTLGALGVVYGDIGTSPLYAFRECFYGSHSVPPLPENILGVLSLVFWSLVIVVSVKYHLFVIRADNRGEGGILALMALVRPLVSPKGVSRHVIVVIGLFGAALLYGDGMLTPAISVLSAVEGLKVATPHFDAYVLPITILILFLLFSVQRIGTRHVGAVFGPIILLWFLSMAAAGTYWLVKEPSVLAAINPAFAWEFFRTHAEHAFFVLGAVFLVVTGGEALYADMGHFGHKPIQVAWFGLVFPALLLNYFGQGALLLQRPEAAHNPFFELVPAWAIYPTVALATCATVIASQAIISGAFSLTRQAIHLNYFPRVRVVHTSSAAIGQIYVPVINWILMIATIFLVLEFRSSSNLAAAYGIAVSTTMVITTLLAFVASWKLWKWNLFLALFVAAAFLTVDLAFFGANIVKIAHGGWFPIAIALAVYIVMSTWERGRKILSERLSEKTQSVEGLFQNISRDPPLRIPGVAIYMTSTLQGTPPPLSQNLRHNKVLHETIIFLTVQYEEVPNIPPTERLKVDYLEKGFYRATCRFGFMEQPDMDLILPLFKEKGLDVDPQTVIFVLGRETLLATERPGMALWREHLFSFLSKNAQRATTYFGLPPDQVLEIGAHIEM